MAIGFKILNMDVLKQLGIYGPDFENALRNSVTVQNMSSSGSAGGGASNALNVTYQRDSNAVVQTAQTKLDRTIYAMDYIDRSMWSAIESNNLSGLDANLITQGIQQAIDTAVASRKRLIITSGIYSINSLTINGPIEIEGEGGDATQIFYAPTSGNAWTFNSDASVAMRNVSLFGQTNASDGDIIQLNGSTSGSSNIGSEFVNVRVAECFNGFHSRAAGRFIWRGGIINDFGGSTGEGSGFLIENIVDSNVGDSSIDGGVEISSPVANFVGMIVGTQLTVVSIAKASIKIGQLVTGTNVMPTKIIGFNSGTGGMGTYIVDVSQSVTRTHMLASSGYGIVFRGSGGLRIGSMKGLGTRKMLWINPDSTAATSIVQLAGAWSIETAIENAVLIGAGDGGTVSKITIVGGNISIPNCSTGIQCDAQKDVTIAAIDINLLGNGNGIVSNGTNNLSILPCNIHGDSVADNNNGIGINITASSGTGTIYTQGQMPGILTRIVNNSPTNIKNLDYTDSVIMPDSSTGSISFGAFPRPDVDAGRDIGEPSGRWNNTYFAVPSTITSDGRDKQDVTELSDKEKAVARNLKGLIRKYRFVNAVEKKGTAARVHFGVVAQDVESVFKAEGLDARDYGLFCYDEWDADANVAAGNRYGIRYDELMAFIIAGL